MEVSGLLPVPAALSSAVRDPNAYWITRHWDSRPVWRLRRRDEPLPIAGIGNTNPHQNIPYPGHCIDWATVVLLSRLVAVDIAYFDSQQERQSTNKRNVEAHSYNHCCRGKAVSITYSECVIVVFAIQHAMRMSRIILSSATCRPLPYFSTLSHRGHDIWGADGSWREVIERKMCFHFLYNVCLKQLSI